MLRNCEVKIIAQGAFYQKAWVRTTHDSVLIVLLLTRNQRCGSKFT
jgi:hypothetical protein